MIQLHKNTSGGPDTDEPPWRRFRVGSLSTDPKWLNPDCQLLTDVSHVAHLEAAFRIVVDGKVRARLISDASVLNQERIVVAWLSPNYWAYGFRYGSIRFEFAWPALLPGHRAYWVESIAYGVPACRILLTTNDRSGHPALVPYDPRAGDGPWWFDESTGVHYWNGTYCLEFMVEHDLELSALQDLDFVKHHEHQCSIDPRGCAERGMNSLSAAALFLARLASSGHTLPAPVRGRGRCPGFSSAAVSFAVGQIMRLTGDVEGHLTAESSASRAVAKALLDAYTNPLRQEDVAQLAGLFQSRSDLEECCRRVIDELYAPAA